MSTTETKPRYIQLSDDLRTRIKKGEWNVGDRLPSFTEMYNQHGAAAATIQKAYDVLEKEGFVERRHRSGIYVTNPPAAQTGTIAYVVPERSGIKHYSASVYSMRLLNSAHYTSAATGYQLTLCTPNQLRANIDSISGCIVQGELDLVKICANTGKPLVSLITETPGVSTVGTDDFAGFKHITHHLLHLGHRKIATLIGSDEISVNDDTVNTPRLQGYVAALSENNINPSPKWHRLLHRHSETLNYSYWGYSVMRQWIREDWATLGCTAIVTQNDPIAIGVIKALRQHGYRVPQDVSVTGYDNSGVDVHFDLKLTTVHVPLEDIAQQAIQLLDRIITTGTNEASFLNLPTHLIVGESTLKYNGGN